MSPVAFRSASLVVLLASTASSAGAQDLQFSVPAEYTSGFAAGQGTPTPFVGSLRSALLLRLAEGRAAVGPAGALLYEGGAWHGAAGVRAGWRVAGWRDAGLFLIGEGLKGKARTRISAAAVVDLPISVAGFLHFGPWVSRDTEQGVTSVCLLIGTDLAQWIALLVHRRGPHVVNP